MRSAQPSRVTEQTQFVHKTGLHSIILAGPLFLMGFALLIAFLSPNPDLSDLSFVWAGLAAVWLVSGILSLMTSEFAVTEDRIILKAGFLHRRGLDIHLSKVARIKVEQGFLGSTFGFGTLVVERAGGTKDRFRAIASVSELEKRILERLPQPGEA